MIDRIIAIFKLIIVFIVSVLINIQMITADMIIPLSLAGFVLLVYGFLNPNDPHIKNLFKY